MQYGRVAMSSRFVGKHAEKSRLTSERLQDYEKAYCTAFSLKSSRKTRHGESETATKLLTTIFRVGRVVH